MADIYVDTSKVRSSAQTLRNANTKLTDKLEEIRKTMKSVDSQDTYSTEASTALVEKFEAMASKRIPEFNTVVEDYAKFLDNVADSHEKLVDVHGGNAEATIEKLS